MKPLKVALICKNENSTRRANRAMGYFSYDVPEFTWNHIIPGKNFSIDCRDLDLKDFDLIFHEDYPYGDYYNRSIPVIFLSIDSTLSEQHFDDRFNQSKKSDLILVDHDDLNRYSGLKKSIYQFPYCVNDKVFYSGYDYNHKDDRERTNDIAFHCSTSAHAGSDERKRIRQLLHELAQKHHWIYKSGVLDLPDYANSFRSSKIVVNQSRTPINRPHRIFDAMACGAMVLSSPLPQTKTDKLDYDKGDNNYLQFYNDEDLEANLKCLLFDIPNVISDIANNGYNTIMQNHTWSIRAKQLREIINKEFGI